MSTSKRVVTSAIEGMSVSKVRRGLDTTRRMWREQSYEHPFFITNPVVDNMPMQLFALKFVMGHHHKRHNKSSGRAGGASHRAETGGDRQDEGDDEEVPVVKKSKTGSKK